MIASGVIVLYFSRRQIYTVFSVTFKFPKRRLQFNQSIVDILPNSFKDTFNGDCPTMIFKIINNEINFKNEFILDRNECVFVRPLGERGRVCVTVVHVIIVSCMSLMHEYVVILSSPSSPKA